MVNKKITIAEMDINVDKLNSKLASTEKTIQSLLSRQKELEVQGQSMSNEYQRNSQKLDVLNKAYKDQVGVLKTVNSNQDSLKKGSDGLNKSVDKNSKSVDVLSKELADTKKELLGVEQAMELLEKAGDKTTKEYVELSDKADKLNKTLRAQEQAIDKASKADGKRQSSLSGVKDEIFDTLGITQGMEKANQLWAASQALVTKVVGGTSGAMKVLKIAIASTGIGLLIVALGSLVTYFASTQEGVDKLKSALVPLKAIFNVLKSAAQTLGGTIVKAFEDPKKAVTQLWETIKTNLVNRIEGLGKVFKAIGKIISSGFREGYGDLGDAVAQSTTGVEDFGKKAAASAKEFAKSVGSALAQQKEIDRLQKSLSKSTGAYEERIASLNEEFEKQKKLSEDITQSEETRLNANRSAEEALAKRRDEELGRLQQQLDLQNLLANQDTSVTDDEANEISKIKAEMSAARQEFDAQTTELQNAFNSTNEEISRNAIAASQEAAQARVKNMEDELQLFIQQQGFRKKSREDELAFEKSLMDKEISILDEQFRNKMISQTEYEAEVLRLKNEFGAKVAEATVQNAADELEAYLSKNQAKIDDEKFFSEQLLTEFKNRSEAQLAEEQNLADLRLQQGLINTEEYNKEMERLEQEHQDRLKEAELTREEAQKEKQLIDAENAIAAREESFLEEQDRRLVELEAQRVAEVAAAEKTGADVGLINEKYAQQAKDIEASKNEFKLNTAVDTLNNLVTILGKESAAGKAAAVASTTISTYQSATSAYSAMAGIPIVGPALGAIAAAAAIAAGLANVRQIMSQSEPTLPSKESKKRYALGGILNGRRHSQGGIPTPFGELESGEAVMTRKAVQNFGPLLSELNYASGGRRFASGGILGNENKLWRRLGVENMELEFQGRQFASGGVLGGAGVQGSSSLIDYNMLAETMNSMPPAVVSVEEINKVSRRLEVIETRGRL